MFRLYIAIIRVNKEKTVVQYNETVWTRPRLTLIYSCISLNFVQQLCYCSSFLWFYVQSDNGYIQPKHVAGLHTDKVAFEL